MVPWRALITGEAHKAMEVTLSASSAARHFLPSSLRRRSGETLGHRPRWFYTPCTEERGHFNGFLLYGRQRTRALEIHRPHSPLQACCCRRRADWHRQKERR